MSITEHPTFRSVLTEQQLADGITTEGLRLAHERDDARGALRIERENHAATKRELQLARLENTRLARQIEALEQQIDQTQRQHMPARPAPETYYHRQL